MQHFFFKLWATLMKAAGCTVRIDHQEALKTLIIMGFDPKRTAAHAQYVGSLSMDYILAERK